MASTKSSSKELARIRFNQQNSRARKRIYVQELEKKVEEMKAKGSHASIELQAAARKVDQENRCLRLMLKRAGINESDVERELRHWEGSDAQGIRGLTAPIHPSMSIPSTTVSQGSYRAPDQSQQSLLIHTRSRLPSQPNMDRNPEKYTSQPNVQTRKDLMHSPPTISDGNCVDPSYLNLTYEGFNYLE